MNRSSQLYLVLLLTLLPTVAHYLTGAQAGPAHDIYQRFCYLPIILAGLWFGVRGGLLTAMLVIVLYFPSAIHSWQGPNPAFYRFLEIIMYVVVGWLTGWLANNLRTAIEAERLARADVEAGYAALTRKTEQLLVTEERLRREERLSALGRLTVGLAHEIRNPLASIKASVEILRSREPDHVPQNGEPDFSAIILEETARLDHTLNEFMQFARGEKAHDPAFPDMTSVGAALQSVLELTESDRKKNNIRVESDELALNVNVAINESLLHQIFLNLIINSVDAMPDGGTFRVERLADEGDLVVLIAEDTGPGVSREDSYKIFDPFFSTKAMGTGLGLSIVERILHVNRGSITLASTRNTPNSRFILKIPRQI